MSSQLPSHEVQLLAIFHEVLTDVPGSGRKPGAFIVAKEGNEMIFWWRLYSQVTKGKPKPDQPKVEIQLRSTNIQTIMASYREDERYVLINSINPASMHQFIFPKDAPYQLIHFIQLLVINAQQNLEHPPSIEDLVDFAADSYTSNINKFMCHSMEVVTGAITLPMDFCENGLLTSKVVVVNADLHITSQLKVISEDFIKHPIKKEEISNFKTTKELIEAVAKRGVDPNIRHIVWPIIFKILPLEENRRDEILKQRVEEYKNVREQWQTLSKTQIKNFSTIKEAFATIRVDVKRTHPPQDAADPNKWSEELVRILRSFTMWNQDIRYTQGLNDIAGNIMTIIAPPEPYDPDIHEALSFWIFANFIELAGCGLVVENMMEMQKRELKLIMDVIEEYHPAGAKWIRANEMTDLTFLISPFMLAYGRSFVLPTIARIWETLASVDNAWMFLRYFSASLVIFSLPSVMQIKGINGSKMVSLADDIFPKLDSGAVIGVALSMLTNAKSGRDAVKSSVKSKKYVSQIHPQLARFGIFQPISKNADIYSELHLFK